MSISILLSLGDLLAVVREADFLATVAVGGVCVRAAVDGRSRRGGALVPPLGEQHQNGGYHRQHQYQAGDGDPDGEAPLRDANAVRIVDRLTKER